MTRQSAIERAMELAYEEDCNQVVGIDAAGDYTIRSWEDPESGNLRHPVTVNSEGEI